MTTFLAEGGRKRAERSASSDEEEEGEVKSKMEAAVGKRGKGELKCNRVLCITYAYRVNPGVARCYQLAHGVTSWYRV